jgi:hypothetical protein
MSVTSLFGFAVVPQARCGDWKNVPMKLSASP